MFGKMILLLRRMAYWFYYIFRHFFRWMLSCLSSVGRTTMSGSCTMASNHTTFVSIA